MNFSTTYPSMNPGEFPHSEISGSMLICSSPKLIAAYHVFHRLPVPRHSPCALVRLTISNKSLSRSACILLILSCQRRLLLPFLLKLQYFLKRTYYNLCFAVIIQFSRYVFEFPFQGPQNRTISNQLVSITCSERLSSFDVTLSPDSLERR